MRSMTRIGVLCIVLLAFGAGPADARTNNRSKPVLFIHGYDAYGPPPSVNCAGMFKPMRYKLRKLGFTGRLDVMGFYEYDYNCQSYISNHGRFPGAHEHYSTPDAHYPSPPDGYGGHSAAELDTRHLAYHIAWYIYNEYTSKGVTVDVVGLSLGGLPIRYAIAQTELHHPEFPPKLKIEDVVTQGAPHGGWAKGEGWNCSSCQVQQRTQEMVDWMILNAWDPDGAGGTDWTAYGSDYDNVVWPGRAVGVNDSRTAHLHFGACHKVIWDEAAEVDHVGYAYDVSSAKDTGVHKETSGTCNGKLKRKTGFRHPVAEAARALRYGDH